MRVCCFTGIASRVTTLANAMSRSEEVVFHWMNNRHCPLAHDQVFVRPIPGVTFVPESRPQAHSGWQGRFADDYEAAGDRAKADAAYPVIMAAMIGKTLLHPPSVAILGRFHRNPDGNPIKLAEAAIKQFDKLDSPKVFLLADRYRFDIAQRLSHAGIPPLLPQCQPLPVDLERTKKDILDYVEDWKTLLAAKVIVTLDGPASALHPAMAAGTRIVRA